MNPTLEDKTGGPIQTQVRYMKLFEYFKGWWHINQKGVTQPSEGSKPYTVPWDRAYKEGFILNIIRMKGQNGLDTIFWGIGLTDFVIFGIRLKEGNI